MALIFQFGDSSANVSAFYFLRKLELGGISIDYFNFIMRGHCWEVSNNLALQFPSSLKTYFPSNYRSEAFWKIRL